MSGRDNDWTIIAVVLGGLILIGSQCESAPTDGCYDADPTQWTEMVCPGE